MSDKRVLKIEIHAESDGCLDKLLEMAIFELEVYRKNEVREVGSVIKRNTAGTAGTFNLEFTESSQEAKELIEQLYKDGYRYSPRFAIVDEVVFEQEETGRLVKLLENPARTEPFESLFFSR